MNLIKNMRAKLALVVMSLLSAKAFAHYPILNCKLGSNPESPSEVVCEASFSNLAKAPNVIMEVYSEDDELISEGHTDDNSIYTFERPDGVYFIIMDAGPGHVLEISDEEVVEI
ncbi:MAG: hypothetical protein MK096_14245 [Oleiphilaceae bacterium]|nr:hypothetical protein [Oleiphilaceae bacterium]